VVVLQANNTTLYDRLEKRWVICGLCAGACALLAMHDPPQCINLLDDGLPCDQLLVAAVVTVATLLPRYKRMCSVKS
jgi:hypothetical protein